MVTQPTKVTDKNGKNTTVHKRVDSGTTKKARNLPQPSASTEGTQPHRYNSSDYTRLTAAHQEVSAFKDFIMERFTSFAAAHENMDVKADLQQGGGYVTFEVDEESLFNEGLQEIKVYKKTAGDRLDSGSLRVYRLPKVYLFQNSQEEEDYASFLALKGKLFGKN